MPVDMNKYPDNWKSIRDNILTRAGGDVEDPKHGARCEFCFAENYKPHPETGSKVILTIAHLIDDAPTNTNGFNLAALCQKCHNTLDAPFRSKKRKKKHMKDAYINFNDDGLDSMFDLADIKAERDQLKEKLQRAEGVIELLWKGNKHLQNSITWLEKENERLSRNIATLRIMINE